MWIATGKYVCPMDDLKDHEAENPHCWCKPIDDEGLLVHNSMDKREFYERGELKLC